MHGHVNVKYVHNFAQGGYLHSFTFSNFIQVTCFLLLQMDTGRDNDSVQWKFFVPHWAVVGFSVPAGNHDDYIPHCAAAVQHVQLWQSRLQYYPADITNTAQEMSVWECQDSTENQYEVAQIKVLVNELLPSQGTGHTMILSNETASLWRADQDKCYRSLKHSKLYSLPTQYVSVRSII
jgi:hypothetical protein